MYKHNIFTNEHICSLMILFLGVKRFIRAECESRDHVSEISVWLTN